MCASGGDSSGVRKQPQCTRNQHWSFDKLSAPAVYAIVFFDKNGTYNGQPDTMPGSPMGVYGKLPGQT
jgi:hypothetical protein